MKIFYTLILMLIFSLQVKSQSGQVTQTGREAYTKIIKFYPNPATTMINFDFQKDYNKSYSFQIFSFVGKKVFELNNVTPAPL